MFLAEHVDAYSRASIDRKIGPKSAHRGAQSTQERVSMAKTAYTLHVWEHGSRQS